MNHGIIYKISSPGTNKIYIGSTKNPKTRYQRHIDHYRRHLRNQCNYVSSFDILAFGDTVFTVLEEVEYENHYDLLCAEKRYILENILKVSNKNLPTQTIKEHYTANKWKIIAKQTIYNIHHADTIREYQKVYQKQYRENKKNKII